MAFKVFNNREEAQDHYKAQLLAAVLRPPLPSRRVRQCMPPGPLQMQPDRILGKKLPFTSTATRTLSQCGQDRQ
jgi:hypothetical protein